MDDRVIALSDSEEEILTPVKSNILNNYEDDFDSQFPPVFFQNNDTQTQRDKSSSPEVTTSQRNSDDVSCANKKKSLARKTNPRSKRAVEAVEKNTQAGGKKIGKRLKPGECLKRIEVKLDISLMNLSCYSCIVDEFWMYEISCKSESLAIPNSIIWKTKIENDSAMDSSETESEWNRLIESHIIIVWDDEETMRNMREKKFANAMTRLNELFPESRPMLVIFGMEKHLAKEEKAKKSRELKEKNDDSSMNSSKISRFELKNLLAELQIMHRCNSKLIESTDDLGIFVYQFTKAIAEIPLKFERKKKHMEMDWYALGDNKDTVKIDKNGAGLKRLWIQQICQFNLATLEIAESICSVYPSPRALMDAYANSTTAVGEKLLSEIPIKRTIGPMTTARKVGPELSKKIFIMFTSVDGETTLGNES